MTVNDCYILGFDMIGLEVLLKDSRTISLLEANRIYPVREAYECLRGYLWRWLYPFSGFPPRIGLFSQAELPCLEGKTQRLLRASLSRVFFSSLELLCTHRPRCVSWDSTSWIGFSIVWFCKWLTKEPVGHALWLFENCKRKFAAYVALKLYLCSIYCLTFSSPSLLYKTSISTL